MLSQMISIKSQQLQFALLQVVSVCHCSHARVTLAIDSCEHHLHYSTSDHHDITGVRFILFWVECTFKSTSKCKKRSFASPTSFTSNRRHLCIKLPENRTSIRIQGATESVHPPFANGSMLERALIEDTLRLSSSV